MKELIKKLRKYEIQIRKALTTQMQGDFKSIFKGSGLEFEDVRSYQYGDDVRIIDWNVTAKGHGTFVKTFKEEKEQSVFFLVDVSGSQNIGKAGLKKVDIAKEICGVLTLSAIKESSHVGLLCFTDQRELFIKNNKGLQHAYQIIVRLFRLKPSSTKTDLNKAMLYVLNLIKRKSVVIFISDFMDENYEHNLKALGRKHDLVVIHISDKRETDFPKLGIIPLLDKESGKTIWVNTSSPHFRKKVGNIFSTSGSNLEKLCSKQQISYVSIRTDEDYVPKLIKLFKYR